jgi:hypothetical protein
MNTITVRSSQKLFTEEEVARLTGMCLEHLRNMARLRKIGFMERAADAAETAGTEVAKWYYTHSDLMVLAVLHHRCDH